MSSRTSTTLWVIIAVLGMGLMQWLTRSSTGHIPPGPARGDVALDPSDLPNEIAGWNQVGFQAPQFPKDMPEGQWWWSHQWTYQKNNLIALVSIDQLGKHHWHELTYCYRNLDWTVDSRTIVGEANSAFVFARLRKPDLSGRLAFSLFSGSGQWLMAPDVDSSGINQLTPNHGFLDKLRLRMLPFRSPASEQTEVIVQCQVFCTQPTFSAEDEHDLQELHDLTRGIFRSRWAAANKQSGK